MSPLPQPVSWLGLFTFSYSKPALVYVKFNSKFWARLHFLVFKFLLQPPFHLFVLVQHFPQRPILSASNFHKKWYWHTKNPEKKKNIVWIQKLHILHEFQILVTVLELTVALTQFHKLLAIGKILFDKILFNFVSVYNVTALKSNKKF